jgi:hypothetical protein
MPISLDDIGRVAQEVASERQADAEVVGVISGEGDVQYAEILVSVKGDETEPRRFAVGVGRNASLSDVRAQLATKIAMRLDEIL